MCPYKIKYLRRDFEFTSLPLPGKEERDDGSLWKQGQKNVKLKC